RVDASKVLSGPPANRIAQDDRNQVVADLADALYAARICAYAQGMALIRAGSDKYNWHVNLSEIGRIWKGGCIIRARLLDPVRHAFSATPDLVNLLLDPAISDGIRTAEAGLRRTIARATDAGIPMLSHTTALG